MPPSPKRPLIKIQTNLGAFYFELFSKKAPAHVSAFLKRVKSGRYEGTIFHRVYPGFILQGGGYDSNLRKLKCKGQLPSEARNGLMNLRGTLSMARVDSEPHSACRQFFINLSDNLHLDFRGPSPQKYGYTVFGQVVSGMEVVDRIAQTPTHRKQPFFEAVPIKPVVLKSLQRIR